MSKKNIALTPLGELKHVQWQIVEAESELDSLFDKLDKLREEERERWLAFLRYHFNGARLPQCI